jgi:7-keto-8-aminopelargonate synthetase-like enzyme
MIILDSGVGNFILFNNKQYSYFAGNNYLGLANQPKVNEAAIRSIGQFGINFSASRITTGTSGIHLELEKQLSIFKEKEDAVVFASGYLGNAILLRVLRKDYSAVFADE